MESTDDEPVSSKTTEAAQTIPEEPGPSTGVTQEEQPVEELNQVQMQRLRGVVKSRRRRTVINHDGNLSTTTDSDDDTISENTRPTPTPLFFSGLESSAEIPSNDSNLSSETDDESTRESVPVSPAYEEFCNPKIPANWFAIKEIYKRQIGYNSRLNGNTQFKNRYYGSLHVAQRLELMSMMEYHDGCVNALGFNPQGNLLASASDDLRVVIWDWAHSKRKTSWVTRHRSNVFQCKFLALSGQSELQLVTSARDGQVWLWQLGEDGLRGSRKLGVHRGASHKLTLIADQPHVILSCGEDALVYSHDVRDPKSQKLTHVVNKDKKRVPLFSIHSHPLITTEFCVSGNDSAVAVFDSRFINKDGTPMKRYQIAGNNMADHHITASMYNYCGNELVVSYNEENIYLFDTTEPEGSDFIHFYQGHRNEATIKGVNFFGPKSEYIISGSDCGNIFFWDKQSQGIVQFLLADKGVVNVLEPHPSIPILGSSGLDSDVKIWIPSREKPHEMDDLVQTVTNNMLIRNLNFPNDRGDTRMVQMLWRVMQSANRISRMGRDDETTEDVVEDDNESDVSEGEATSGYTTVEDTDSGDDLDGNVECFTS